MERWTDRQADNCDFKGPSVGLGCKKCLTCLSIKWVANIFFTKSYLIVIFFALYEVQELLISQGWCIKVSIKLFLQKYEVKLTKQKATITGPLAASGKTWST